MSTDLLEGSTPKSQTKLELEPRPVQGRLAEPAAFRLGGGLYRIVVAASVLWAAYWTYPLLVKVRSCLLLGNRPAWCLGEAPFIRSQALASIAYGIAIPLAALLLVRLVRWIGAGFR